MVNGSFDSARYHKLLFTIDRSPPHCPGAQVRNDVSLQVGQYYYVKQLRPYNQLHGKIINNNIIRLQVRIFFRHFIKAFEEQPVGQFHAVCLMAAGDAGSSFLFAISKAYLITSRLPGRVIKRRLSATSCVSMCSMPPYVSSMFLRTMVILACKFPVCVDQFFMPVFYKMNVYRICRFQ